MEMQSQARMCEVLQKAVENNSMEDGVVFPHQFAVWWLLSVKPEAVLNPQLNEDRQGRCYQTNSIIDFQMFSIHGYLDNYMQISLGFIH